MENSEITISLEQQKKSPQTSSKVSYYNAHAWPFVFQNDVSSDTKIFCLLPANLATPGNITRNNVSATMFPS